MEIREKIREILQTQHLFHFGCCRYEDTLPLLECRAKARLPQAAKSIIVVLFPYYIGEKENANLSKYARVPDYHHVAGKLLQNACDMLHMAFADESFSAFADNSPIREVRAAYLAGLGVIGRHGLLINSRFGSYCFIGEIVTTMVLPYDQPVSGGCMGCMRCRQVCPGGALQAEGLIKERCLSFLTQKKGMLTDEETQKIRQNGFVWGCDRCQDICPHNRSVSFSDIPDFYQNNLFLLDQTVLERDISSYAFAYRGKSVLYRNLGIIEAERCDTTSMEG